MVTDHSNTVYDCATCGRPVHWKAGQWHHFGSLAVPCSALVIIEVRLPVPSRDRGDG